MRLLHSSLGRVRVPGGLCKIIRGNNIHKVQARVVSKGVCAAKICSRLKCMATDEGRARCEHECSLPEDAEQVDVVKGE